MFGIKQAGRGFLVLNVIRVMNIIALLDVVGASWIMLVMTVKTSNFFFFDGVSHFITSTIGLFLIISELSLFKKYFETYWPLLCPHNGFIFLGLSMLAVGFEILGNLNKNATSVHNLGLPMWRVVISSGCLSAIMGTINVVASFIFSEKGKTARQIRAHGATTPSNPYEKRLSLPSSLNQDLPSYYSNPAERRKSRFPFRLPLRASHISKPVISDPQPYHPDLEVGETYDNRKDRSSPIVPGVERPPTAMHPANLRPPPAPRSSTYSVASNITRFTRI
ncbi:hypothetical protein SBOR_9349 [Sclerotinia borealis F-4128]|uniref:DUF7598 domain-containing protein n=1 Tax=Sclerotinia borealis (strain F-4128) TaxID=1432307 RepID=W9C3F8_SCLBF|nr:hypothetical protein SBOR_9349 [Sclerotinia borealis F-4128]